MNLYQLSCLWSG